MQRSRRRCFPSHQRISFCPPCSCTLAAARARMVAGGDCPYSDIRLGYCSLQQGIVVCFCSFATISQSVLTGIVHPSPCCPFTCPTHGWVAAGTVKLFGQTQVWVGHGLPSCSAEPACAHALSFASLGHRGEGCSIWRVVQMLGESPDGAREVSDIQLFSHKAIVSEHSRTQTVGDSVPGLYLHPGSLGSPFPARTCPAPLPCPHSLDSWAPLPQGNDAVCWVWMQQIVSGWI